MNPTKSAIGRALPYALIVLVSGAFMPGSFAQEKPAAAASASPALVPTADEMKQAESDRVVQLNAFEVTTDIGAYHEETSSMATKVATNLKELSSSLQILNSNSISDRNATSLQDVYNYVIGIFQSQGNTNGFSFRGFPNTGTFTQNLEYDGLQGGMFNHSATSAADVESLEFLKGQLGPLRADAPRRHDEHRDEEPAGNLRDQDALLRFDLRWPVQQLRRPDELRRHDRRHRADRLRQALAVPGDF